ncbi:hypothetical protein B0J14DRAFT_506370, partial [Halenospora varia]
MEGLGAAASAIAVMQISAKVFDICRKYYLEVRDARSDIQRLCDEMTSLQDVLVNVADLSDAAGSEQLAVLQLLEKPNGPLQECQNELNLLLQKLEIDAGKEKMRRFGMRALKWPFSSTEVMKIIATLGRYKSTFNLALSADQITLALAIDQAVRDLGHDLKSFQLSTENQKVLHWLSTIDYSSNHEAACKKHHAPTGDWLFQHDDFKKWKEKNHNLLWLYGIPGCGKTVLSSTIIESLREECNNNPGDAISYFYFDFNDAEKQGTQSFISSLIVQLCQRLKDVPGDLMELHDKCETGQQIVTLPRLTTILKNTAHSFTDTYIVIDAIDECPRNDDGRNELLTTILDIKRSGLQVLVTSRFETDIEEAFSSELSISIDKGLVDADIQLHVANELATNAKLKKWSSDIKDDIMKTLLKGSNGMFRWVYCQLEALKKCLRPHDVRKTLRNLPKTLHETYSRLLSGISDEYEQEALTAMTWLVFSERPLLLEELAEALVVNPQKVPAVNLQERLPDPMYVLDILGSLITISSTSSESTMFAHFSVKEFLLSTQIKETPASKFSMNHNTCHAFLTESCL